MLICLSVILPKKFCSILSPPPLHVVGLIFTQEGWGFQEVHRDTTEQLLGNGMVLCADRQTTICQKGSRPILQRHDSRNVLPPGYSHWPSCCLCHCRSSTGSALTVRHLQSRLCRQAMIAFWNQDRRHRDTPLLYSSLAIGTMGFTSIVYLRCRSNISMGLKQVNFRDALHCVRWTCCYDLFPLMQDFIIINYLIIVLNDQKQTDDNMCQILHQHIRCCKQPFLTITSFDLFAFAIS